jgi:hypothetical protein
VFKNRTFQILHKKIVYDSNYLYIVSKNLEFKFLESKFLEFKFLEFKFLEFKFPEYFSENGYRQKSRPHTFFYMI